LAVEIPTSHKNVSRGFGFVTFSSIEEATKANNPELKHEIDGRQVRTGFANKREKEKEKEIKGKKLYIGKLPVEINEDELKNYFERFGKVIESFLSTVKFAPLLNGFPQHKGYGFVTFDTDEEANKAVAEKNHVLKNTNIFVRKAIPLDNEKKKDKKDKKRDSSKKQDKRGKSQEKKDTKKDQDKNEHQHESKTEEKKKPLVVLRKEQKSHSTESKPTESKPTESKPTESKPTENKSSGKKQNEKKTSPSENKSKSVTVTKKTTTTTKPVIVIEKNPVNPWRNASTTTQTNNTQNDDFPSLGEKKKSVKKTVTTTTTTTTTTIETKDEKDEKKIIFTSYLNFILNLFLNDLSL